MPSIDMTPEQKKMAEAAFGEELDFTGPDKSREGKDRLTVRFNSKTLQLYKPTSKYRYPGMTLLSYSERPAVTPTGGHYVQRAIRVATRDGRRWWATLRKDFNVTGQVTLMLDKRGEEDDGATPE